ncbi:MAG: hypothetical protein ACYT04_47165 [Nostoc sp.]
MNHNRVAALGLVVESRYKVLFFSKSASCFLGRSYFEPTDVMAKFFNPKSTPIASLIATTGLSAWLKRIDA